MEIQKPCKGCIVLANCSAVCNNFLQWCIDTNKPSLQSHPHFQIATISTDQITWMNENMKTYNGETPGFLFTN